MDQYTKELVKQIKNNKVLKGISFSNLRAIARYYDMDYMEKKSYLMESSHAYMDVEYNKEDDTYDVEQGWLD